MKRYLKAGLLSAAVACGLGTIALAECQATQEIKPKSRLTEMSVNWFGDSSYRYAILLATNARSNEPGFSYISNPDQLWREGRTAHVCIPDLVEAERLRNLYDTYIRAVTDMAVAHPSEVSDNLTPIAPEARDILVATWVRQDQATALLPKLGTDLTMTGATWVTVAPHLKSFCQDYVENHSDRPSAVTLRLEQRLGMPPNASKTHFATYRISDPLDQATLVRPCGTPDVTSQSCSVGPPSCDAGDAQCHAFEDFFYQQYYGSYGREAPIEYPWTSLGYTFDWGPDLIGLGARISYVEYGESEYVMPPGAVATLVSVEPTMDYCAP